MSKTQENLMAAFAGESQANRKYLAYAKQADKEGLTMVAKLFRAAAEAETIHAHTHLRNAGKISDTAANLQDAISGETYEFTKMYPEMIKDAEAEGNNAVAKYMGFVNAVEEVHAKLYQKAAANELSNTDFYICPVCGYTHEGPMTEACPVCNIPSKLHALRGFHFKIQSKKYRYSTGSNGLFPCKYSLKWATAVSWSKQRCGISSSFLK